MFAGLTLSECIERFDAVDCCFAPVLDLNEATQSEYHRDRGFLRRGPDDAFQALFPASIDGKRPTLRELLKDLDRNGSAELGENTKSVSISIGRPGIDGK